MLASPKHEDSIDAAIHSAESLFASLLERPASTQEARAAEECDSSDPEQSLSPRHREVTSPAASLTLQSLGVLSLGPAPLTAHAHAPLVQHLESPEDSLSLLGSRVSVLQLLEPPSYDKLYSMLQEREQDLELAARIGQALLHRAHQLDSDLLTASDLRSLAEQQLSQLRLDLSRKDSLLRLYASDAQEREGGGADNGEQEASQPEWARVLADECRELRDSNVLLRNEADMLRHETTRVEQKEKDLVQQCLRQFGEAKERLAELREEADVQEGHNQALQDKVLELSTCCEEHEARHHQLVEENEVLREQVSELHESCSHTATEMAELQDKYDECSIMLKEATDAVELLKEASMMSAVATEGGQLSASVEHESIVKEIEEALRQEIIAASTLPERPRSPNLYARQRTMVVMETVRAATLAQARRLERLKAEAEQHAGTAHIPASPSHFSPIAASSPSVQRHPAASLSSPSPIPSDPGSAAASLPEDLAHYRMPGYSAPQKLQIVKPMEGSVTLLRWKLLATPQLGGAKSYFSGAVRPGVHMKGWRAAGIRDEVGGGGALEAARHKSVSMVELPGSWSVPHSAPSSSARPSRRRHNERLNVTVGAEVSRPPVEGAGPRDGSLLGRVLGLFSRRPPDRPEAGVPPGGPPRGAEETEEDSTGLAGLL